MNEDIYAPPRREIPSARLARRKERLMQDIANLDEGRSESPNRSPRRRRVVAGLLVPAALLMAGGAYALTRAPASATVEGVFCAEDASGDSGGSIVGADGRAPEEVCAELWAAGNILPNESSAPPLQACTLSRAHYVGVFPSADPNLCASLGLDPVPMGYEEAAAAFSLMRDDLARRLEPDDETCVGGRDATSAARETLDLHGFEEWTIERVGPWSPNNPCTSYYFDAVQQVLHLYAEPRPRT